MKKEQFEQGKQGTGSAEQTGRDRNEQLQQGTESNQKIASQIGEEKGRVGSLNDLGAMSGRDDASGGSGDRMENESTGEATDR